MNHTNKNMDKKEKNARCGVVTCIHCVLNNCMLDECDMQEKTLMQEE